MGYPYWGYSCCRYVCGISHSLLFEPIISAKTEGLTYLDVTLILLVMAQISARSQTAIGSGGFLVGYLEGTQSQLNFIPESHS